MELKKYRVSKGIAALEAARELKVNPTTLWRWERGRALPDQDAMSRIAEWSKGKVQPNDLYATVKAYRENAEK